MPAAAAAIGVGLAATAGGMALGASTSVRPSQRNYRNELLTNLEAQREALPVALDIEQTYGPKAAEVRRGILEEHGPGMVDALRGATGTKGIMDMLIGQAETELGADSLAVDPRMRAELQQTIRTSQTARGMGFGLSDVGAETALTAEALERLRRTRQGFGMDVVRLAGETAGGPGGVIQTVAPGGLANPESSYAEGVYSKNQDSVNRARSQNAQARWAMAGGLMNMGGSVAGAALPYAL